jgi:hypothetical protein
LADKRVLLYVNNQFAMEHADSKFHPQIDQLAIGTLHAFPGHTVRVHNVRFRKWDPKMPTPTSTEDAEKADPANQPSAEQADPPKQLPADMLRLLKKPPERKKKAPADEKTTPTQETPEAKQPEAK